MLAALTVAAGAWVAWSVVPSSSLAQEAERPAGWDDATHGSRVAPDYARLFNMDQVHELRIMIAPEDFTKMRDDLQQIVPAGMGRGGPGGPPGFGGPGRGGFGDPNALAQMMASAAGACEAKAPEAACTVDGMEGSCNVLFGGPLMCIPAAMAGLVGRGGGAPQLTTRDPIYVPVTVTHDGRTWTKVGMRYKGNSSLMSATMSDSGKVPFRLNFDRYEDAFPGTRNQRFYGFGDLTFSSGFSDDTQLKELLATELLRDRGVPAARAAFYRVFADVGNGPEYWGVYTMIEDPSDGAMLASQFGDGDGNLYKPDGPGADWSVFNEEGFGKKNNEKAADFSDVSAAVAALHASRVNPAAWREAIEKTFDVDLFLRWLAVNTVMDNWDAYGVMAHNYYLYADPSEGHRLHWIPWDHNMAFGFGPGGGDFPGFGGPGGRGGRGGRGPGAGPAGAAPPGFPPPGFGRGGRGGGMPFGMGGGGDVLHRQVGDAWPLIQRFLADEVYAARYRELLEYSLGGLFAPDALAARARDLHNLIAPYIVGEQGERATHTTISSPEAFNTSLHGPDGLLARVKQRQDAVRAALE